MKNIQILISICFFLLIDGNPIIFEPSFFTIESNKTDIVKISLLSDQNKSVCLNFTYGDENEEFFSTDIIKLLDPVLIGPFKNQTFKVKLFALKVGHLVISAKSNDIDM